MQHAPLAKHQLRTGLEDVALGALTDLTRVERRRSLHYRCLQVRRPFGSARRGAWLSPVCRKLPTEKRPKQDKQGKAASTATQRIPQPKAASLWDLSQRLAEKECWDGAEVGIVGPPWKTSQVNNRACIWRQDGPHCKQMLAPLLQCLKRLRLCLSLCLLLPSSHSPRALPCHALEALSRPCFSHLPAVSDPFWS